MRHLVYLLSTLCIAGELHSIELLMLHQELEDIIKIDKQNEKEILKQEQLARELKEAFKQCSQRPRGIKNTTGNCFLNVDLQLWRAIFCIPGMLQEINTTDKRTSFRLDAGKLIQNTSWEFQTQIFEDFTRFWSSYSVGNDIIMHKRIFSLQTTLENVLAGLRDASCTYPGRAHIVTQIFLGCLMKHQSIIDSVRFNIEQFNSGIGMVLNTEACKAVFDEDIKLFHEVSQKKEVNKKATENVRTSLESLTKLHNNQAYIATEIAHAVGFGVFIGMVKFSWPKVLLMSSTKLDSSKKTYVKIKEITSMKSLFDLHLSQYGFSQTTPQYRLIAFSAKLPEHTVAIVKHDAQWFYCSNEKVAEIPNKIIMSAENSGYLGFGDFIHQRPCIPEILIYERQD
jgi:hypothetical protein